MKKKAIERISYIGLKKNIRPKTAKYIGITAIRIVGHEKHLFLEVYRNAQNQAEPVFAFKYLGSGHKGSSFFAWVCLMH